MKKLFKCSVCGYVHEGTEPPKNCPKCGVTSDKFIELSEEDSNKIYRSDKTNSIHAKIIELSDEIVALSLAGIEDNLDPACVSAFERAKDQAWITKQISKAEIESHMKKGKW